MFDEKEYMRKWREDNPEKVREIQKRYRKKNHAKRNEYNKKWKKERYKTDLKFNLNFRMSESIRKSLIRNKNNYHWEDLVGYTLNGLIKQLNKTLPKGYIWQDYMEGKLQIDHIVPMSVYNFDNPRQVDFQRCWALSNLQLLPARENRSKHNKLLEPFQPALKI